MTERRAFVCDSVCAMPYGHNAVGLKYFVKEVESLGFKAYGVASRFLPDHVSESYGFIRKFGFYYHEHIRLNQDQITLAKNEFNGLRTGDSNIDAKTDIQNLFDEFKICSNDILVYPCVDYYSLIALINLIGEINASSRPGLYVRFIGVMESATQTGQKGLEVLIPLLRKNVLNGVKISFSAETPAYADFLSLRLGAPVNCVSYPIKTEAKINEFNSDKKFIVSCPGSARIDKGYLLLGEIFRSVRKIDSDMKISFSMQSPPSVIERQNPKYANSLYAIPGLEILPSAIDESEMDDLYRRSSVIILPYDSGIYKLRGSAVFMESIGYGVPVIALSGSAFCDQIKYYGAGKVVNTISEICEAILSLYNMRGESDYLRAIQARHRYDIDTTSSFKNWIQ